MKKRSFIGTILGFLSYPFLPKLSSADQLTLVLSQPTKSILTVTGEMVCFEDLRRSYNARLQLTESLQRLISSLPDGESFRLSWKNKVCVDPSSPEYNPMGNVGRFVAVSADSETANVFGGSSFKAVDDYMIYEADRHGVVTNKTIIP